MHCTDTNTSLPAIRCSHVDTEDVSMIEKIIAFFKETCEGNGVISLIVNNGKIQRFDPTSRIEKRRHQKKAG